MGELESLYAHLEVEYDSKQAILSCCSVLQRVAVLLQCAVGGGIRFETGKSSLLQCAVVCSSVF